MYHLDFKLESMLVWDSFLGYFTPLSHFYFLLTFVFGEKIDLTRGLSLLESMQICSGVLRYC